MHPRRRRRSKGNIKRQKKRWKHRQRVKKEIIEKEIYRPYYVG